VRIILADDQLIVRSALRLLLNNRTSHTVIAEVATAGELIAQMQAGEPDLVLVDWGLLGGQPAALLADVHQRWPTTPLIVLSSHADIKGDALQAGAAAFVSKTGPPEDVLVALGEFSGGAGR